MGRAENDDTGGGVIQCHSGSGPGARRGLFGRRKERGATGVAPSESQVQGLYRQGDAPRARILKEHFREIYRMFPILRARAGQTAGTLSGGEQQMLALCRGLMSRPKLLLLDEPSTGLAPKIVVSMFDAIRNLAAELGIAVLLAEQNVPEALRISDRGYVLETGEVVLEGSSEEIEHNPRVLEAYLGGCAVPEASASDERR